MKTPLISVILPVYNASEFLLEALESISSQTYKNWELIAINDGSTDDSLKILTEYSKIESRLKIITRENKGIAKSLNEGIKLAKGDLIARMDADDICMPERFEKQVEWLEITNSDLCGTWYEIFNKNITRINELPIDFEEVKFFSLFASPLGHPCVMGKRLVFLEYLYDESLDCAQDYELWCRMLSNKIVITNVPLPLLKHRVSNAQVTHKKAELQWETGEKSAIKYFDDSIFKEYLPSLLLYRRIFRTNFREAYTGLIELNNLANSKPHLAKYIRKMQNNLIMSIVTYGPRRTLKALKIRRDLKFKSKILYIILSLLKIELFKSYIYKNPMLKNAAVVFSNFLNKKSL